MDRDGEIDREAFEDIILQVSFADNACDLSLHGVASASFVRYEGFSVFHRQKRICICPFSVDFIFLLLMLPYYCLQYHAHHYEKVFQNSRRPGQTQVNKTHSWL